jgi:hypothetical protein
LVEYVDRQRKIPKLLAAIESLNPNAYAEFTTFAPETSAASPSHSKKIDNKSNAENISTSQPPKVFLSYSDDSLAHLDKVLSLADSLRQDGIDANIDRYQQSPVQGWQRWMLDEIDKADFVLVICTEQYDRRFRGNETNGKGKGVTWEGAIVIQELYDSSGRDVKFVPITFTAEDIQFIPIPLRSKTYYNLGNPNGYESLYRYLTQQPVILSPELGAIKILTTRDRYPIFPENIHVSKEVEEGSIALEISLRKNNWQEANSKTGEIIASLDRGAVEIFDSVIYKIDFLWKDISQGVFGFGIQKRTAKAFGSDIRAFAKEVGWLNGDGWIDDSKLIYDIEKAPLGHLPWHAILHIDKIDRESLDRLKINMREFLIEHDLISEHNSNGSNLEENIPSKKVLEEDKDRREELHLLALLRLLERSNFDYE